jgi:hypothetical protein
MKARPGLGEDFRPVVRHMCPIAETKDVKKPLKG